MPESSPMQGIPTPYYKDDSVVIYNADCREIGAVIDADVVVTDPPYGTGSYPTDVAPGDDVMASLIGAVRTAAVFGYPERLVSLCVSIGLTPDEWITWWPTNTIGGQRRAKKLPRECEHIAVFGSVPGATRLFRPRSDDALTREIAASRGHDVETARLGDVWRDASPGVGFNRHLRQHPNEKPLSLMLRLVELCSDAGEVVFDPFAGSGTTLRAAKDLGRKAIGVEVEERYCLLAAERLAQEVIAA